MKLHDLINQLQEMQDKYGGGEVEVAYDSNILDSWQIDRICFFKDGEEQRIIIVEKS